MMTTTHAFAGAAVGATTAAFAPELTPAAMVVGFVAGTLPDADLVAVHRRTTHFPVWLSVAAVVATLAAAVLATPTAILAAVAVVAAAVHSLMDVLGGGAGPEPWTGTSDRGVYDHYRGRWIRPRRWVRWAGAPEDLALTAVVSLPTLWLATGTFRSVAVGALVLSILFATLRRPLHGVTDRVSGTDDETALPSFPRSDD
jgi:hypothetical protein